MNLQSGLPYWLIKNGLLFDYPKLEQNIATDVLVMGGGISGALTAYHLLNAGIDCIVADGRSIGLGSTCASTSLLQYEIDVPLVKLQNKIGIANAVHAYQLCALSIEKLATIASKISFTDFALKKSLYFAAHKKHMSFLNAEYNIRKENNFKVHYLNKSEIKDLFNFEAPGAILSEAGGVTNAYGFTHALHQYNLNRGGRVYDRTFIKEIDHSKNQVKLRTAKGMTITAKKLIYANGYEAINYISKKIIDLNSTYATASESDITEKVRWKGDVIYWNTAQPYLYIRSTTDGRIIVGGRDEKFYNPRKRDKLIDIKTAALKKDFNYLFPQVEFNPEFSWTGVFGATSDGLPYIGPYKKLPNSYFALGFGGNGITFSLIAAEIITGLILGKKYEDAGIFGFERN